MDRCRKTNKIAFRLMRITQIGMKSICNIGRTIYEVRTVADSPDVHSFRMQR